ncbi:uncharacterized protein BJ171DRAFT_193331 [Polychytrium aggregatum]|uniref:uncharacterized protein n=1 Tax=Polychytrium aggregatum TaxID=110093 RepID=UPI0022FEBFFD|nr:uncharacterized protein BJ171DRAFT_193331 [Polychytrium aggregatum]KAI9201945.1 hypothetical protein BJ171DRAFT_193331 [Polychytrium aggregatum]
MSSLGKRRSNPFMGPVESHSSMHKYHKNQTDLQEIQERTKLLLINAQRDQASQQHHARPLAMPRSSSRSTALSVQCPSCPERHSMQTAPLKCSFCDQPGCAGCRRECCSCHATFCSGCSRVSYDGHEERVLCIDCWR